MSALFPPLDAGPDLLFRKEMAPVSGESFTASWPKLTTFFAAEQGSEIDYRPSSMVAGQHMRCREQFVCNMAYFTEGFEVCVILKGGLNWSNFEVNPRLLHHQERFSEIPNLSSENNQDARSWKLNSFLLALLQ